MPDLVVAVNHKVGLHARPAALFVQTAARFKCSIKVTVGERTANAKSILSVLTLGAGQGTVLAIHAEGEDADQALAALGALVRNNFGEEE